MTPQQKIKLCEDIIKELEQEKERLDRRIKICKEEIKKSREEI